MEGKENKPPERRAKRGPEKKKEIPLSWFIGVGKKDVGIMMVSYSAELNQMGDGAVGHHISEYSNYMASRLQADPSFTSSRLEDPKEREIVQLAEREVKKLTGFEAKDILAKRTELNNLYRGKEKAPFDFRLM